MLPILQSLITTFSQVRCHVRQSSMRKTRQCKKQNCQHRPQIAWNFCDHSPQPPSSKNPYALRVLRFILCGGSEKSPPTSFLRSQGKTSKKKNNDKLETCKAFACPGLSVFNEEAEDMGIHLTNRAYKKDCNKMIDFFFFGSFVFKASIFFPAGTHREGAYIPGSSRYVKCLPFGRFFGEFRHKFYTQKEDPSV